MRCLATLAFAVTLLHFSGAGVALADAGDITCGGTDRFLLPELCNRACSSQGLKMRYCALSPETSALKAGGDEVMKQIQQQYNQAMFGPGIADHTTARLGLGCTLVNNLYPPYRCTQSFAVTFAPSSSGSKLDDPDYLAKFTCDKTTGRNTFAFTSDLFWTSPAYILSIIGHELVHADQCQRYSGSVAIGVDRAQHAFSELEAYSWEAGKDSFPRTFKVKAAQLTIMRPDEAQSVQAAYACASWNVDDAVARFLPGAPYAKYVERLRSYMTQDLWIKTVWLPQHPHWDMDPSKSKRPDNCEDL
jgi:hypothetical protein